MDIPGWTRTTVISTNEERKFSKNNVSQDARLPKRGDNHSGLFEHIPTRRDRMSQFLKDLVSQVHPMTGQDAP